MAAIHLQTVVGRDGTLTLRDLPLLAGHMVEVLVRDRAPARTSASNRYPLRGTAVEYKDPFDSVAEEDWDAKP